MQWTKRQGFYEAHNDIKNIDLLAIANENIFSHMQKDQTLIQAENMSNLPSIYKKVLVMPDGHQGYGFPIGGVAAFDYNEGIISPGGVGFDINCGVSLLKTNLFYQDIVDKKKEIANSLFQNIPVGMGSKTKQFNKQTYDEILSSGLKTIAEKKDYELFEEKGSMKTSSDFLSDKAKGRGLSQLGTMGAGNHFIEIQKVVEDSKEFNLEKNQIMVMIHSGSRGFGHQIASDYLRKMQDDNPELKKLPEKDLIYANFHSELGQEYFSSMKSASNFAWTNRYLMAQKTREVFSKLFKMNTDDIEYIYDVSHNIAKIETHENKKLIVHRKGATRAFSPNHDEIPNKYQSIGQPVIIPGSMGTHSYLLTGTNDAMKKTFGSSAHGAGRELSRKKAIETQNINQVKSDLEKKGIFIKTNREKSLLEESPKSYKNIDEVIKTTINYGIGKYHTKLDPIIGVKG